MGSKLRASISSAIRLSNRHRGDIERAASRPFIAGSTNNTLGFLDSVGAAGDLASSRTLTCRRPGGKPTSRHDSVAFRRLT
jgi:hypothetical protein